MTLQHLINGAVCRFAALLDRGDMFQLFQPCNVSHDGRIAGLADYGALPDYLCSPIKCTSPTSPCTPLDQTIHAPGSVHPGSAVRPV